jgi:hypothetical protein
MSYKLENWYLIGRDVDPFKAPEQIKQYLGGEVYGNPNFKDGEIIRTSSIQSIEDGCVVTSSGSKYELGEPDEEYEAIYPGAKERLLKLVKEKDEHPVTN